MAERDHENGGARVIPVPEVGLGPEEMIGRARRMRAALRGRQEECEALGELPTSTRGEFLSAGFFRVIQPRRFGGYEFDLATFVRVAVELARGCPASGWVFALTAGHPHVLSAFPEKTQVEVYGEDGDVRVPLVARPVPAVPVEGGYRVSGFWDYVSGSDIATHMIGAMVLEGSAGELRYGVIPRESFRVEDNWDPLGLRGTASRRVVVEDLFVPQDHTVPVPTPQRDKIDPADPDLHPGVLYRGGTNSLLFSELAAVSVGIARYAIDLYTDLLSRKTLFHDPTILRRDDHEYQRYLGRAIGLTDTAEAALIQVGHTYMDIARSLAAGNDFDEEADRRLILTEQMIVRLATEAVDTIFHTAGSATTRNGDPLQRLYRDMSMIPTHIGLQHDRTTENVGRLHLNLPAATPL